MMSTSASPRAHTGRRRPFPRDTVESGSRNGGSSLTASRSSFRSVAVIVMPESALLYAYNP